MFRLSRLVGVVLALAFSQPSLAAATRTGDVEPGLDMILVDPDAMPAEPELAADQPEVEDVSWSGAPIDLLKPTHHLYTDLRRQLIRYQSNWSSLPQVRVPAKGGALAPGADNARVHALRERLGLEAGGKFDAALEGRLAEFQRVHGLSVDGTAGPETLEALNRGALYYERKLLLNMERARRLPSQGASKRYILVDAGAARLWMYEDGRAVDSMKVVVGAPKSATPMMAALMRYANINPYWNVPADLVGSLIAPRVLSGGVTYLSERRYEVLESWEADAKVIDPATVDWQAVASGQTEQRVRQLPGGANSMGAIKFMMPNEYGIYLHDTPNKALFGQDNRWVSNGCVRLEDAERLAKWIFGAMPRPAHADREDHLDLFEPLPVYITYLTVESGGNGALFRPDPYDRDAKVLARFADAPGELKDAKPTLTIDLDAAADADKAAATAKAKAAEKAKPTPAQTTSSKPASPAAKASATKPAATKSSSTKAALAKAEKGKAPAKSTSASKPKISKAEAAEPVAAKAKKAPDTGKKSAAPAKKAKSNKP